MPKDKAPKLYLSLQRFMGEETGRKRVKKNLSAFLAKVSGRVKMSEEEVFQRLEGRP
jgi:hypothetical protein